jgi:hypothetical protein
LKIIDFCEFGANFLTKISSNFLVFSSPGPRFGCILRHLEERIQKLVDMASFGPVEVGDFRVAKEKCFEKKFGHVKNIEKKRFRLSAVPGEVIRVVLSSSSSSSSSRLFKKGNV